MRSPYRFWGIHDSEVEEVYLWFSSETEAHAELLKMLRDEPVWAERMKVVRLELLQTDAGWMN